MIERVAKALWADRHPDDEWTAEDERDYLGHARAAIEAMREPTQKMVEALIAQFGYMPSATFWADVHNVAIDAALGPICSTCNGTGEIDEGLGGIPTSGIVPCPDCKPRDSLNIHYRHEEKS